MTPTINLWDVEIKKRFFFLMKRTSILDNIKKTFWETDCVNHLVTHGDWRPFGWQLWPLMQPELRHSTL